MKINPISVLTYVRWDHVYKAVFEKNEQNGNVKIAEERYPIYNNKGNLIEPTEQGSKIDLKT
jgi:hypothetical protein